MSGLIVLMEGQGSDVLPTSLEALGLGRELATALGLELVAVTTSELAELVAAYAPDRAYAATPASEQADPAEWYTQLLARACSECDAAAVVLAHTQLGQDVAPRLAARLGGGVVTDAVRVAVEGGGIVAEKPVQGGVALATYAFKSAPAIVTVRRRVGGEAERGGAATEVTALEVEPSASGSEWRLVDRIAEESAEVKLEDAEVVVSGGRGMGGPEGFELVSELASLLGGAVGSSRPPCDAGWIASSHQVGITGKVISPGLYVAVGVSGASQHLSGMSDSKKIVAINKDADAEIFRVSDYGVVADYKDALPALIAAVKEHKGG